MELVIAAPTLKRLHSELLASAPEESAAFLAVEPSRGRLLVRDYHVFREDELEESYGAVVIREGAQLSALADIKRRGHAVVEVHTHPGSGRIVNFSGFDEQQLKDFSRYLRNKMPDRPFGALVFSDLGYAGRLYQDGVQSPMTIRPVGELRAGIDAFDARSSRAGIDPRYDRQVLALGPDGQRRIGDLRVAVVGLGGTGSLAVQQLAHLGVTNLGLIEDDRVESTNLPRLAGATWLDALLHRRKTTVARRTIRRLHRGAHVFAPGSLRTKGALEALKDADLIVGCVDNDGARLILSELAAAYLVPYVDIGVGIEGDESNQSIGGRVSFFLPGGPCLACADDLDFAEAAEDLEAEQLRKLRIERGYARDRRVEPALMPLNTVLAGLAMIEVLAFATGVRAVRPFTRFDAVSSTIVHQNVERGDQCSVCAPAAGMGDRQAIDRYVLGP